MTCQLLTSTLAVLTIHIAHRGLQPDLVAMNALTALETLKLGGQWMGAGLLECHSMAAVQLKLPKLRNLHIRNFTLYNPSMVDCPKLQRCCLAHCSLHGAVQLPVALTSLTSASMALASEEWLPSVLSRLSRLNNLNLSYNGLQTLPRLDMLTKLSFLEARCNKITSLPRLPPLVASLILCRNRLNEIPLAVESLMQMRLLSIADQEVDLQISRPLSPLLALPCLSHLCLGGCSKWSLRSKRYLGLFLEEVYRQDNKMCLELAT